MRIIRDLRLGNFDVLIGHKFLREGLDLPEVSLVAILMPIRRDSFVRTGRLYRQAEGPREISMARCAVCDQITGSMKRAIDESNRRRKIQHDYNIENISRPNRSRRYR